MTSRGRAHLRVLSVVLLAANQMGAQRPGAPLKLVREKAPESWHHEFSEIGRAFVLPGGTTVVSQHADKNIVLLSSRGHVPKVVGRSGGGPGEFQSVSRLGRVNSSVWIADILARRVTFFSESGDLQAIISIPSSILSEADGNATGVSAIPLAVFADSATLMEVQVPKAQPAPAWAAGRAPGDVMFLRVSRAGVVSAVVTSLPGGVCVQHQVIQKAKVSLPLPFCALPLYDVGPNGASASIIEAKGGFELTTYDANGALRGRTLVPYQPPAMTEHLRDSLKAIMKQRMRIPFVVSAFESLPFPSRLPAYKRIVVGDSGGVWVEVNHTRPGHLWIGFDEHANRIGSVLLPGESELIGAVGRALLTAEADSDGAPTLARWRVSR